MSRDDRNGLAAPMPAPLGGAAHRAVGLDIGATKWFAIADGDASVFGRVHDDPARTLAEALERVGPFDRDASLACSFAGVLDRDGTVDCWPNRPSWSGFRLAQELAVAGPVIIEDDGVCAAIGERVRGAATDAESFCCITIGTGVGSGLFLEGRLRRPLAGRPAGIGHVRLGGGRPCRCSRTGCLQAELLEAPDVDRGAARFAEVVADLAVMLDLELIVLTGGRLVRDERLRKALVGALAAELSELPCEVRVSPDPMRSAAYGARALAAGLEDGE